MNLFARWTQSSLEDCRCSGLCADWREAATSRCRVSFISLGVIVAALSLLVLAVAPAAAQTGRVAGATAPQETTVPQRTLIPQRGLPPGAATPEGVTPEQVREFLKSRSRQVPQKPEDPNLRAEELPVSDANAPQLSTVGQELSTTERLLSGEIPIEVSTRLQQFGYDLFSKPVSTFAPVTDVPVGPDYVIGPGDTFTLTMWGRVDAQHMLQVDRNGQIVLPEVGALKIWGMKFGELPAYLQHELSRKYTDFKMSISMDRLRVVQIFVVGETASPGSYTISSLSTVINALFAAGGPSKNGTLRKIRLLRNGSEPVEIDLYKFLLGGDKGADLRLQDGDTIFIPLIGPVVGVAGNVRRPAIYEMSKPTTLRDVLDLAGGITFAGWLQQVQVERTADHHRRIVVDFDLTKDAARDQQSTPLDTILRDGDVVKVLPVVGPEQDVVYIEGHVNRPGKCELKPGMKLSDVIGYETFLPQVNLEYAEIERLVPPDMQPVMIPFHLGRLLNGDPAANLELACFDRIRLFRWDEKDKRSVSVSGMVYTSGEFPLIGGMRVTDLIRAAGGLEKNAYLRMAELTRRHISQDGMVAEKIDISLEKALAGDPGHNIVLQDYDYLVIRPVPDLEFDRVAMIEGEVRFPGTYPVQKGETLSSLIERAGGYSDKAYLKGSVFTRESAKTVQRQRMDKLIRELEESLLTQTGQEAAASLDPDDVKAQQAALAVKQQLLTKLRAAEVTGRIVMKLADMKEFTGSQYDIELEAGDTLTIPQVPGVVHVVGEVFNPTSLLYEEGRTVSYYLNRVGGMTKEADKKQVAVVKADGSVISIEQGNRGNLAFWDAQHKSWFFGGFMNMEMEPGDTVVVPRKLDRSQWLRNTRDLTQIIFQIAVAAGIVFAI